MFFTLVATALVQINFSGAYACVFQLLHAISVHLPQSKFHLLIDVTCSDNMSDFPALLVMFSNFFCVISRLERLFSWSANVVET